MDTLAAPLQVRKDGQGARTQIQLATKSSPSLVERYFIYVSQDVAKKLKSECEWRRVVECEQALYRVCVDLVGRMCMCGIAAAFVVS
jgi:hypothetical protein